jgi:Flp pilus assembly protein TadG
MKRLRAALRSRLPASWRDTRASVMVEFAIVGPVFILLLLVVFQVAYDLFLQEVLDSTLAVTARQMQINQTQTATATGSGSFTAAYFCPNSFGFVNCNNVYVRVETVSTARTNAACLDVYQMTTGELPVSNGQLGLSSFTSESGAGTGPAAPISSCDTNSGTGYCNPAGQEFVILTAIYVGPSFLNGYLPGTQAYKYNGHLVRAQMASTGFETESYTALPSRPSPC